MTAKRDLKRRIRERQSRTGESYVTARRRVLDQGPASAARPAPSSTMDVVELIDLTADAERRGLRCRIMISPRLAGLAEPAAVLARLHDALAATEGDPATGLLRDVALRGRRPPRPRGLRSFATLRQFLQRTRAGLGGANHDGSMLALPVAGRDGLVMVVCTVWHNDPALVLTTLDGDEPGTEVFELAAPSPSAFARAAKSPLLFLIFDGKRHEIAQDQFVIGRNKTADLTIRDGKISRKHAAVIRRADVFYIKDLGSVNGIVYMGMQIDNKRIDEGDVFQVGDYEVRFTYVASD